LNVRNIDKLALALDNVWIGQCRIWAREARFGQFASESVAGSADGRRLRVEGMNLAVVRVKSNCIKNARVGKQTEVVRDEGEKMIIVGKVEVMVEDTGRKKKVRRVLRW